MKKYFRNLLTFDKEKADIVVFGVPYDCNASIGSGAASAPNKLKQLSWWLPPFTMDGKPIKHKVFVEENLVFNAYSELFKYANIFDDDKFKIIFGGDHSISIPFQKSFIEKAHSQGKEPVIIHIDAHCDICDIYFGNKYSHACTIRRALDNGLKESNLFMIGIREFEEDGYDYLIKNDNDIHLFKALDVHENGFARFESEIKKINNDKYSVYVSFDIDSLDCAYSPGTGTPETCGLTPLQMRKILVLLAQLINVACIDIVEVAPPIDVNDVTSWTAIKLLYEFIGNLNVKDGQK